MCGIAGMYSFKKNNLQPEYFKWCLTTMKHRGPDGEAIWHNNKNYITAFARLAIRDLSHNADQPMLSECGNYCISFNGEIYNTKLLADLLKPYRTKFVSTSDTELLLYSLIHLGINKTLEIADGVFAFAFYDTEKNKLILARDRMGVKPLYAGICDDGIVYSSQYDHIINHSFFVNENFDKSAIASYLSLGYMPENSGVISKTKLLPHGYYTIVENGKISSHRYYDYAALTSSEKKILLNDVLQNAVNSQLVSDVPLGAFMSGGIDSTLISYYANKSISLKSFTIGITDSEMDESREAKAFADFFDTEHFCKNLSSKDMIGLLDENAMAFTEPFADYSSLPTLALSKFAKKNVTVALSGDGGDELFWGYPRNRKALNHIHYYKKKLSSRRVGLLFDKMKNPAATDVSRHWKQNNFIDYYYSALWITGAAYWLPQICKAKPSDAFFLSDCRKNFQESTGEITEWMNIIRKMEMDIHLQRILLKVDRASMFHSLEVRVPFLNNDMLALSLMYNYTDCLRGDEGKINLRKLLIDKSGSELVKKYKKGFTIPIDEWIRKEIKNEVTEKIMDMPSNISGIFNRNKLQSLLSQHISGKADWGWFIWAIYCFVKWEYYHYKKN